MLQQPRKKIETTNTYRTITATPRTEKYSNTEQSYSLKLLLSNANTDKLIKLKKKKY